jgi:hypothetical protein
MFTHLWVETCKLTDGEEVYRRGNLPSVFGNETSFHWEIDHLEDFLPYTLGKLLCLLGQCTVQSDLSSMS